MRATMLAVILAPLCRAQAAAANGFGAVEPLLQQYCADCHDDASQKGGLDLWAPAAGELARLTRLRLVRQRLAAGDMPPPAATPPAAGERQRLLQWLGDELRAGVPRLPPDPGRVTVRRLSRGEWEYCVLDLFGVQTPLAATFPADDLGYGFDNIGDALSTSALHAEKYLAAAAAVAAAVLDLDDPRHPQQRRFEAEAMTVRGAAKSVRRGDDVAHLLSVAGIEQRLQLPRDGSYRLQVLVGADQAGDEPARLQLLLDDRQLVEVAIAGREPRLQQWTLALPGGDHRLQLRFPNDYYRPDAADPQQRDRNLHIDWLEVIGPLEPRQLGAAQWLLAADPGSGAPLQRGRAVAAVLLPRLWRRPVTGDEVARSARLAAVAAAAGEPFAAGMRLQLQAALCSPHFLFRCEPGGTAGAGGIDAVPLSALASRLSFFLWSSVPDSELLAACASQALRQPELLQQQVARMLQDPRADRLAANFASQWLELRALAERAPDPQLFPGCDEALRQSMRRETELLFRCVLRDGLDVRRLLDAGFSFVDRRLAAFYGLPWPEPAAGDGADGFVRVELPPALQQRGGILGHAGVLTLTSNPTRTSPVKRGKWILDNLLGQAPPPPPPGNSNLPDEQAIDSAADLRQQLAQHRARPACASCHLRMDPIGLSLERFDAVGRWRERDAGGAVDATGDLPDGRRIDGIAGLKALLVDDPAFVHTLLLKLFVYAVGRDANATDRLRLELAADELLARGRVTLADLVQVVVASEGFLLRAVGAAAEGPRR